MNKKVILFILFCLITLTIFFGYNFFSLTGYFLYSQKDFIDESNFLLKNEVKILGYCPTMVDEVILLKEKGFEIKEFSSAAEVLFAFFKGEIDVALIGRKAEKKELPAGAMEEIIKSGYTLVSNKKSSVEYADLSSLKINTDLDEAITKKLLPNSNIKYCSKKELLEKISNGEIALISWNDWIDDFGLVVVVNGNEKVKDFRGAFLYSLKYE